MERFRSYREYLEKQDKRVVFALTITVVSFIVFSAALLTFPFKGSLFAFLFSKPTIFANTNKEGSGEASFVSNQLLVKVKKNVKAKVKENPKQTGISSLDKVGNVKKLKKFEKVAKTGKKSNQDAELFSWYLLEFDEQQEVVKGSYDAQSQTLATNNPSGKMLRQLMAELRQDPDIEAVEPNFIVNTTQTGCETQMALSLAKSDITTAPGGSYTNTLYVKNNGVSTCGPVNISASFPGGWTQVLNPGTITVTPGQTVNVAITMKVGSTSPTGSFNHYLWLGSYGAGSVGETVLVFSNTPAPTSVGDQTGYIVRGSNEICKVSDEIGNNLDTCQIIDTCRQFSGTPTFGTPIGQCTIGTAGYAVFSSITAPTPAITYAPTSTPFITFAPSPIASPSVTPTTGVVTPMPTPISAIPNDPYYGSTGAWGQTYPDLWGMKKISMEGAWQQTTGNPAIVVADVDTGVDRNHPDLSANMWVNSAETPSDGVDNDGNGYVDDYYGWDFLNNDNDPMDDHGHGTHTAGTVAAVGNNNVGVVGVNWNSRIMALKFLGGNGSGSSVGAVRALQYAADMGARVSTNSWSCSCVTTYYNDAIKYEHQKGMVVVVAAGNDNVDAITNSPAGSDQVITVAASDSYDRKAGFSNWGEKIDVAAPGVDILSTRASVNPMCTSSNTVGGSYCRVSGTSMATPHVAGLAALLLSKNPALTNEEVRQIIRTSADDLGTPGQDRDFGYGRINAAKTISNANSKPLTPVITSPTSRVNVYGTTLSVMGGVGGENFASYKLEVGGGRTPTVWREIANSTTQVSNNLLATIQVYTMAEGYNVLRLSANTNDGKTYRYEVHDIFIDNVEATLLNPTNFASKGNIEINGTAMTKNGLQFSGYRLEWGEGASPVTWSTAGITLVNNGQQQVQNGVLGTWDTSGLNDGQTYSLRLITTGANGVSVQDMKTTKIDKDLVKGWPKQFMAPQGYAADPIIPVLADIDGDGVKEVLSTDLSNGIYAYRKDGSIVPGFPFRGGYGEVFDWHVNVADVNKDGKMEIIGVAQKVGSTNSRIYVVNSNGTAFVGWPAVVLNVSAIFTDGVPAVADLDGNGILDLITVDFDPASNYIVRLHAYNLNGTELSGFPKSHTLESRSWFGGAISVVDLDNDGALEIAYGNDRKMYLFDKTGNLLPGWPFTAPLTNAVNPIFKNSQSAGDIDGDGKLEIIAVATLNTKADYAYNVLLYAFRKDGSVVSGFPLSDGLSYYEFYMRQHTSSLADIDGDGKDEIFAGLNPAYIFDGNIKRTMALPMNADTQIAIADADGDGYVDMTASWKNELNVAKLDGSPLFKKVLATVPQGVETPVVADLDKNGKADISVTHLTSQYVNGVYRDLTTVFLYELPSTSSSGLTSSWPMYNANAARTGKVLVEKVAPIITFAPPTNTPTAPTLTPTPNYIGGIFTNVQGQGVSGVKVGLYPNGSLSETVFTDVNGAYKFSTFSTMLSYAVRVIQAPVGYTLPALTTNNYRSYSYNCLNTNQPLGSAGYECQFSAVNNDCRQHCDFQINVASTVTPTPRPTYTPTPLPTAIPRPTNTPTVVPTPILPSVSITSPVNNAIVKKSSRVTITANASSVYGITKVEFYVNNVLTCTDTTSTYSCLWRVPTKTNILYTLQAKAYDTKGVSNSSYLQVRSK